MVVNASVTQSVLTVFRRLYDARFPIRRMVPVDAYGGSDPASMDADNTSGFNCRNAVAPGPPLVGARVRPGDRREHRRESVRPERNRGTGRGRGVRRLVDEPTGMAYPGGVLVDAFAAVGWQWGGRWSDPDYQHFSATGG